MIYTIKSMGVAAVRFWFAVRRALPLVVWLMWLPFAWTVASDIYKVIATYFDPFISFKVISINVPNHCYGGNPSIHVTRFVKEPRDPRQIIHGRYQSQFVPDAGGPPVCARDALPRTYKPQPQILWVPTLYEYMGESEQCRLPAGKWRGQVVWSFDRPMRFDAVIPKATNVFEV